MESTPNGRSTRQLVLTAVLAAALLGTAPIDRDAVLSAQILPNAGDTTPSAQVLPNEAWGPAAASTEGLLAAYAAADPERIADFFTEDAMILTSDGPLPAEMILDALRFHFQNLTGQRFDFDSGGGRPLSTDHALTWMIGRTEGVDQTDSIIFEGRVAVSIIWRRSKDDWKITYIQEALWR